MSRPSVLIVGAGPTGLILAIGLARRRIPFRIISDARGPAEHSRAMGVHARTLEFYRQFGFADAVIAGGIRAHRVHLREPDESGHGHDVATFSFDELGDGISLYPFMLTYPQDDHERFLVGRLREGGVAIEWGCELTGFSQDAAGVAATIIHSDGSDEQAAFDYICGCDGAHSAVRRSLKIDFPGGTYEQLFYVADVRISRGFDTDTYVNLGKEILALMLPVRSSGMQRLIGLVPPALSARTNLTFEDIRAEVEALVDVRVDEVNWFATYRVHHRVAAHFHVGRAFLLGDAGHIHSPAGGQGMNTGIGDAVNLGWKLADVIDGRTDAKLLDSYEPERIAFARKLVETTDRAFTPMIAGGIRGELVRRIVAPLAANTVARFAFTRHAAFRTLSQTHIRYGSSTLSEGKAGKVRGGDRLPWTGADGADNHAPLGSCDWQVHVYGRAEARLAEACTALRLPLHVFAWTDAAARAGFHNGAAYLIRPDGYVALAAADDPAAALRGYLARLALRL